MKKQNKLFTSLLISGLLTSSSLFAWDSNRVYDRLSHFHINTGLAQVSFGSINGSNLDDVNTQALVYGFGFNKYWNKYALEINYNIIDPTDDTITHAAGEFSLGYRVTDNLTPYGLFSVDFGESSTSDGFGFGVGVRYQMYNFIAINAQYNHASMNFVANDGSYDINMVTVGLQFNFRKKN